MSANRRRTTRNTGGSSNRSGGRPRTALDKSIIPEGVYANPRFSHLAASLVGCVVQLQVKNGGMYDGILKTYSPKMDVVLEMAHKHEESSNNNQNAFNSIPSRDCLIEKLIFNVTDILSITALSVDMDYAVKDTFTDTAISKCNTNHTDMDMKELQPWEGGIDGDEIGGLDKDSSNGWDADDMFRTNAERFNVKTSYDESLTQYTTPLEKKDTKEFKNREEAASRLAKEIENTEQYEKWLSLENGDGDEEEKFSAVKRTNENNTHITNMQSSGGGTGKYVPPARRPQPTGRNISQRSYNATNHTGSTRPVNQHIPPRLQNQHYHQHAHPPTHPHTQQQQPQQVRSQPVKEPKVNGNAEKEERERRMDVESSIKTSPGQDSVPVPATENKNENLQSSPGKHDRRNSNSKVRETIKDLLEFKVNFKLGTEENKTDDNRDVKESEDVKSKEIVDPVENKQTEEKQSVETESSNSESQQKDDVSETVKNSTLNPKAKEFVLNPNAKIFQPKQQPQQVPTPPRPHTQSPITPSILQPMPPAMSGNQYIPFIPPNVVHVPQQPSQQQYKPAHKRAVVSLNQPRPDLTAAQAAAATGQPLFNQTSVQSQPYSVQYYPVQPVVQPGFQMGQVMPMPAATGHRMVTPTSVPMVPTSLGAQSNQSHGNVYMTGPQAQPVPAHMQFPQALPAHMPIPGGGGQPQQGGQMNPQSSGHPAPSPVQQHTGAPNSQTHQQVRPPTSGTPQPQGGPYPHMAPANMQGHPPLIPSPQNQSSQQTMHPTMQYQITSQAHQLYNQTPFSQTHPPTSSVTQSMHGPSHNTHQIVVMPNPHPGQVQPGHPPQPSQQYQHHMSGAGQQHMMQPTGVPTGLHGSNPNNVVHHFVPQVQGGPVQPYQQHTQNH